MAEGILKFDLNDSDDIKSHLRAVKSLDMALAIWEIVYNMKKGVHNNLEYGEYKDLDKYDLVDKIFEQIYECIDAHGIKIDELIS